MNARLVLKPLWIVVTLALLVGSADGIAADGVSESFDRMLAHRPGPATAVTGADRDADPLTVAIVEPLRQDASGCAAPTHLARARSATKEQ